MGMEDAIHLRFGAHVKSSLLSWCCMYLVDVKLKEGGELGDATSSASQPCKESGKADVGCDVHYGLAMTIKFVFS